MVKNLPAKQETQVQSLGQEDPLEKEIASRSSFLAWEIPWVWQATVHEVAKELDTTWRLTNNSNNRFHDGSILSGIIKSYSKCLSAPFCTFKNLNFCFLSEAEVSGTPHLQFNKHSNLLL